MEMTDERFILRNSNTVSSNYPSERVYDNKVKRDLYNSEIVIMLNKLWEENEQLKKENENLKQQVILAQKRRNVYMKALLER